MRRALAAAALAAGLWLAPPGPLGAAEEQPAFSVFDMPDLVETVAEARARLRAGDAGGALALAGGLRDRFPEIAEAHVVEAMALAALGRADAAVAALERSVELGFRALDQAMRQAAFAGLRDDPRIAALAAHAARLPPGEPALSPPVPAPAIDGVATVTEEAVGWDARLGVLTAAIDPGPAADRLLTGAALPARLAKGLSALGARGEAAGNAGDLYDNRDRGHSPLDPALLPQITRIAYGAAARRRGLDQGIAGQLRFSGPVIGNSSTAVTGGPLWRSLPRQAMTAPPLLARAAALAAANHLYVYPEHRDHDPGTGDLFPANVPYFLVSQGSSYSDKPFVAAAALAMAAFRPETKARLLETGLLVPTLQMVIRRAMAPAARLYLSGAAHPAAFDGAALDPLAVMGLANGIEADAIPPEVRLAVEAEEPAIPGRDYMAPSIGETLFDSRGAIARVMRRTGAMALTVSAEATEDPNGRPLVFHWRVLTGDPRRIGIETLGPTRARARIRIPWHEPMPVPGRPEIRSARVDIGVFAENGRYLSAPAFVTVAFPTRQARAYGEDGRILSVDYADPARASRYEDPVLFPARGWRDDYAYAPDGTPLGWTRRGPGGETAFAADGALVLARDDLGRPSLGETVAYRIEPGEAGGDGRPRITWEGTGARHAYRYAGPEDRAGVRAPLAD